MAHPHLLIFREVFDEPSGDLFRRPFLAELPQHIRQQRPMTRPPAPARPGATLSCQPIGAIWKVVSIVRPTWMASKTLHFPGDRRAMAFEPAPDLGIA